VPRGKYCRNSRLVFSFVPRCLGLCGSQKYTCTSVATVKSLCFAISSPRSHVSERRRVAGSLRTCRLKAATTTFVSLLDTLISMAKRERRSTRGRNVAVLCATQQIAFPMAGKRVVFYLVGHDAKPRAAEPPVAEPQCSPRTATSGRFAGVELECADASAPVKAAGRRVILLRIPEGAVVARVDRHAAVIAPAFE